MIENQITNESFQITFSSKVALSLMQELLLCHPQENHMFDKSFVVCFYSTGWLISSHHITLKYIVEDHIVSV